MNKSAMFGFAIGVVVFVLLITGYFMSKGPATAPAPAASPRQTPIKTAMPVKPPALNKKASVPAGQTAAGAGDTKLTMMRELANGGAYQKGGTMDVTLTLATEGAEPVRAMGVVENLPEGWTFDGVVSTDRPDLSPPKGRDKKLEFAWFNIPKFPASFTYRIKASETLDGTRELTGEALYRTNGPELRSPAIASILTPGGPAPAAPAATPAPAPAPEAAPAAATPAPAPEAAPAAPEATEQAPDSTEPENG